MYGNNSSVTEEQISDVQFIPNWGQRLKHLREVRGYSRTKAAQIFGITESRLQNLELQRVSQVYADELFRMCTLYSVDISSFFRVDTEEEKPLYTLIRQLIKRINGDMSTSQTELITQITESLDEHSDRYLELTKNEILLILQRLLNSTSTNRI